MRSLRVAWLEGWHAGAPPVLADDAPAPAVSLEERWPEGRALPEAYLRPMIPCPACRLVRTDKGRRAALMVSGGTGSVVHFACRECGHGWKLPARSA